MSKTDDRRNFLKLLLSGGMIAAAPVAAAASSPGKTQNGDTVTMLTEDGKLVEIDRAVYEKIRSGKKVTDLEIHDFIKPDKGDIPQ